MAVRPAALLSPASELASQHSGLPAGYANLSTPSRDLQSREEVQRIERAFAELPADYQEAISLQRLCGMAYGEIASRMQRSEGAVRNLVHRGLSRLALRLGELRREDGDASARSGA